MNLTANGPDSSFIREIKTVTFRHMKLALSLQDQDLLKGSVCKDIWGYFTNALNPAGLELI
jgi:hypothetical protein